MPGGEGHWGPMRRIKLEIEFDGEPFEGWQRQSRAPSVQGELERALGEAVKHAVTLHGAGRTDSGVHARGMVAHFDTTNPIPAERLPLALRGKIPKEISVVRAEEADAEFDARRDAVLRWYRYQILQSPRDHPLGPRAWIVRRPLDVDRMRRVVEAFAGEHDFVGFRTSQCTAKRTRLTMEEASVTEAGELLAIDFKCRSFLQRMVRLMVGAVVAAGDGKVTDKEIREVLRTGRRPAIIRSVPAHGLCLMGIAYDEAERANILTQKPNPPSF